MKPHTVLLLVTLILLFVMTGLFASDIVLKKEYDKMDKSDLNQKHGKISIVIKYEF